MSGTELPEAIDLVLKAANLFRVPGDARIKLDGIADVLLRGTTGELRKADLAKAFGKVILGGFVDLAYSPISRWTPDVLTAGIQSALSATGGPAWNALSREAVDWILKKLQISGIEKANPPRGRPMEKIPGGGHLIRYFVEEDANGELLLPVVKNSPLSSAELMYSAFRQWQKFIHVDFAQTGDIADANLVITSASLAGKGIDESIAALTDIGPPGGLSGGEPVRLRMVFDSRKTYARAEFVETCAHEFGHVLGVRPRDVAGDVQCLMSPVLNAVTAPQPADIQAVLARGWTTGDGGYGGGISHKLAAPPPRDDSDKESISLEGFSAEFHSLGMGQPSIGNATGDSGKGIGKGAGGGGGGGGGGAAGGTPGGNVAPPVGPVAAATGAASSEVLRRTPHLDASNDGPLHPGDKFRVSIYADESAPHKDEVTEPIEIVAPSEKREFEVSVWVVATSHFEIIPPKMQTITIRRDEPRSTAASFELVVLRNSDCSLPSVTAVFRYENRPCGSVKRSIPLAPPAVAEPVAAPPPRVDPPPVPRPKIEIHLPALSADINVVISNPDNDGKTFECLVSSPNPLVPEYHKGVPEPWTLGGATADLVKEYFKEFTNRKVKGAARIASLRGAGLKLFETAPHRFKELFWRLSDANQLRTISIVSSEPYIPWELMIPERRKSVPGQAELQLEQRKPLGVEFLVGRWVSQDFCLSRNRIVLSDSWVFAPRYTGPKPKPLPQAPVEAEFVCKKFRGEEIDPADFDKLDEALGKSGRSLLHFVCHGSSDGAGAQLIIGQNNDDLTSTMIRGADHIPAFCTKSKPFVFLNACEVGCSTPALIGIGGFAPTFIEVGVSCVVAPLWSIKDTIAHQVAQEFYNATVAAPHKPFAEILREIRARAYGGAGEDTYAAYCFYGDPLASQRSQII